jgi:hypothetical protein
MIKRINKPTTARKAAHLLASIALLAATLFGQPVSAITYISAEPIPSPDVVGASKLATILSIGYPNLELWSHRLVQECRIVESVIKVLSANDAISTVDGGNTSVRVAAGGFEGVTDPTYVFALRDSGRHAVSAADVGVLDNALGYVLNQSGTTHFSPDHPNAYDFPLDYAVVTFNERLSGVEAKAFFDYLGTIDPALWNANFAGFTQIALFDPWNDNSMLFLQPGVSQSQFVQGLFTAARTTRHTQYFPVDRNRQPTTATAGVSFPGNDWVMYPGGDQYLAQLGNHPSPRLLRQLAALRQQHLQAVANLVSAIEKGKVNRYLHEQFTCPR